MNNLLVSRHIILMRHGQSAEKQEGQADRERVLTPEGEDCARKSAQTLLRLSVQPDYLLSSRATRAKMTAQCANEILKLSTDLLHFVDDLYEATPTDWSRHLAALSPDFKCILCVGHNPTLSVLASDFARQSIDLQPGAFAIITSEADSWINFRDGLTELGPTTLR